MPEEAAAAVAARQAAMDLCQRCALDAASDLKAEDLWFPLLQVFLDATYNMLRWLFLLRMPRTQLR